MQLHKTNTEILVNRQVYKIEIIQRADRTTKTPVFSCWIDVAPVLWPFLLRVSERLGLKPFFYLFLLLPEIRSLKHIVCIRTAHSRPQKLSLWQVIQVTCSSCARHGTQFSIDLPTMAMMSHNVHQVFIILGDTSTSHYISMIPWALDDPHVAKFPNMIRSDSDVCYSGIG